MTSLKESLPPHLKKQVITTKFIKFLKKERRWEGFVASYREAKMTQHNMLNACKEALRGVMGGLTFVWFGEEQLHSIHIDPHLILPELQKL
jgi:hypothetical protein